MDLRSFVWNNAKKHRVIKNGDHYIALEIYLKLDWMGNRVVTSSGSRDYVGISGKELTNSLTLRTKIPNNKEKDRTSITDITNHGFRNLLREFKFSHYIDYKRKHFHNESTEDLFFLIKQFFKINKIKKLVCLHTKRVKFDVNKTIGHVNINIQSIITSMNGKELESTNVTRTCKNEENKHKENSSTHVN